MTHQGRLWSRLCRWPRNLLIGAVHAYRLLLQPWIGNRCRYEPSCSAYALQCLHRHGAIHGGLLSAWRILRCNPLSAGGHDPVPGLTIDARSPGSLGSGCAGAADPSSEPTRNRS